MSSEEKMKKVQEAAEHFLAAMNDLGLSDEEIRYSSVGVRTRRATGEKAMVIAFNRVDQSCARGTLGRETLDHLMINGGFPSRDDFDEYE